MKSQSSCYIITCIVHSILMSKYLHVFCFQTFVIYVHPSKWATTLHMACKITVIILALLIFSILESKWIDSTHCDSVEVHWHFRGTLVAMYWTTQRCKPEDHTLQSPSCGEEVNSITYLVNVFTSSCAVFCIIDADSDMGTGMNSARNYQPFAPTAVVSGSSSSNAAHREQHTPVSATGQSKQSRDPSVFHSPNSYTFMFDPPVEPKVM